MLNVEWELLFLAFAKNTSQSAVVNSQLAVFSFVERRPPSSVRTSAGVEREPSTGDYQLQTEDWRLRTAY
jgi:hypothetical protein